MFDRLELGFVHDLNQINHQSKSMRDFLEALHGIEALPLLQDNESYFVEIKKKCGVVIKMKGLCPISLFLFPNLLGVKSE